jgi:signal transduction histidine kinase
MNPALLDSILEAALHTVVTQRCQRAYLHEVRNGMQGVHATVDVLKRAMSGKLPPSMSIERLDEMARKAVAGYDETLEKTARQLIHREEGPTLISLAPLLRELCSFLKNDATAKNVQLKLNGSEGNLHVGPDRTRLVLLSVMTRCIDSMRGGGQLAIESRRADDRIAIEFDLRANEEAGEAQWVLNDAEAPLTDNWVLYVTRQLIVRERGTFMTEVSTPRDAPEKFVRVVRLTYPGVNSSPEAANASGR